LNVINNSNTLRLTVWLGTTSRGMTKLTAHAERKGFPQRLNLQQWHSTYATRIKVSNSAFHL